METLIDRYIPPHKAPPKYRTRLFHGVKPYPWTSPQDDLAAARKLIEACGYWHRKEELEHAEAAAKNW